MNHPAQVLDTLRQLRIPGTLESMQRFGVDTRFAWGIPIPALRSLARTIGTNHPLALGLWPTGVHEARILASMVADLQQVTRQMTNRWVYTFYSWDLCDQVCGNLLDKTPFAADKAKTYALAKPPFVKRAGFVLMAGMAVHCKTEPDSTFLDFLPLMEQQAWDERNFVKKAVNWALRQTGKRNQALHTAALQTAQRIACQSTRSARWIATDALRELGRATW